MKRSTTKNVLRRIRQSKLTELMANGMAQIERMRLKLKPNTTLEGNILLHDLIRSGKPFCFGKLGATERRIVCWDSGIASRKFEGYFPKKLSFEDISSSRQLAGIFPVDQEIYRRFAKLLRTSVSKLDLVTVFFSPVETRLLNELCPHANYASLGLIEDFGVEKYWTRALAGKKVAVISPFEKSIYRQYARREQVWPDGQLPSFDLKVIRFPFLFTEDNGYKDIFAVYDDFCAKIRNLKSEWGVDVVITGCGGLSLPLAVYAKEIGLQGIHTGGSTQVIFGIDGKRWENRKYKNKFWIHPDSEERPQSYQNVEGGCYW